VTAPRPVPAGTADWGLKGRVLVVEDNQQVSMIVRDFLEQLGFTTELAVDVESAIASLDRGEKYDAIFSDILMPGGRNGLDLAREVRRRQPDMLVILTTGYGGSADDAAREGYSVLRKPYGLQDIGRVFKEAMLQSA
jgi:DNA-binding NtrC family response regulator